MKTAGNEPCRGKSRLGKRKCADVGPKQAGDSWRSDRKIYKTGDYVASGGKYTQCRNKSTGTTQGADRRKPNATNKVGGGNIMRGGTGTTAAPIVGQKQGAGRGSTGWSALTESVKMFGPAAITQDFSKKI